MKLSEDNNIYHVEQLQNELEFFKKELTSVKTILESIKNSSADYIVRYNRDLRIIFASNSLCQALNKKENEIIGKSNKELGIPIHSAILWNKTMKYVLRKGRTKRVEFEIPFNGNIQYFEAVIVPEKVEKNDYGNILSIVRDITTKKKTEKQNFQLLNNLEWQKKQMEELLARDEIILNNMSDGVIIYDAEGVLIYMNEASKCFYDIFGTPDIENYITDYVNRYEFCDVKSNPVSFEENPLQRSMRREKFNDLEIKIKNNHTGKIWYSSFSGSPVFDVNGNFIYSVLTVRDITGKKAAEIEREELIKKLQDEKQALADSEKRYRVMGETILYGVWSANENGNLKYVSSSFCEMIGKTLDEINNIGWINLLIPEQRDNVLNRWVHSAKTGETFEQECYLKDKNENIKIILSRALPVKDESGNISEWVGINLDITDRKHIEEEHKRDEYLLLEAGKMASIGAWQINFTGENFKQRKLYWSDKVYEIFGYEPGSINVTIDLFFERVHPQDRKRVSNAFDEAINKKRNYEIEHRIIRPDGTERIVLEHSELIFNEKGFPVKNIGAVQDITDRKKMELELKHSEERFRKMFEMNKAVMLIIDPNDGSIIEANDAACDFYGYAGNELKNKNIHELNILSPDDIISEMQKALNEKRNYFVFPHKRSDGQIRWVEVYSSPFITEGKKLLFSVIHDITERKSAEQALKESQFDLAHAQKVAQMGSWKLNLLKNKLFWSDETYRIFGIPTGTPLTYELFLSLIHPEDKRKVDNTWKGSLLGGAYNIEHRIIVDGKTKWVHETSEIEFDHKGNPVSGFGTVQDITKQKEIEHERERLLQEVKLGEQKLKWALEAGNGGAWDWDPVDDKLWWSPELYNLFGIKEDTPVNYISFMQMIDVRDNEKVLNEIAKSISNHSDLHFEFRIQHPKKGERWMENHGKVIYDDFGLASRLIGISLDITERKKGDKALRESEEKFATAFRSNPNAIFLSNVSDGRIFEVNDTFLTLIGRKREDVIGESTFSIKIYANPADRDRMMEILKNDGMVDNFEIVLKHSSGAEKIVLFSIEVLKMTMGDTIMSTIQDITSRREMEENLRMNEIHFRETFEHAPVGLVINGLDGKFLYINEAYCKIIGYSKQEILNPEFKFINITFNEDKIENLSEFNKVVNGEIPAFFFEKRYIQKNGNIVWVRVSASARRDNSGKPFQIVGLVEDISERKKAEELLRENEQRLQAMFNNVAIGIVETDGEERFALVNDRLCEILDYKKEDLIGKTVAEITHIDDRSISKELNAKLHNGELKRFNYEKRYIKGNGLPLWVHVTVSAIYGSNGNYLKSIATVEDISERKKAEEELAKALADAEEGKKQLQYVIEAAELGTWSFDIETGMAVHSERHDQIFGYREPQPEWSYEISVKHILPEYHQIVREAVARAIETGFLSYEAKIQWPDGSIHWIAPQGRVEYSAEGKPLRMGGIVSDITKRKNAEEKLIKALEDAEEVKNILTAMMEHIPLGIAIADADEVRIRMVSRYGQELLEKTSDEISGISASEHQSKWGLYHSDSKTPGNTEELPLTRATLNGEVIKNEEWFVTHKDGSLIPILCSAAPIRNKDGEIIGGVVGLQDITKIKNTQDTLKKEHELLQTIIDTVPAMITIYDPYFQKIKVNNAFEKITGWTNADARENNIMELVYPEPGYRKTVSEYMQSLESGFKDISMTSKNGSVVESSWANVKISDGRQVGIGIDINTRKKIEEELRNSEYRFRMAMDNLPYTFVMLDKEGRFKFINKFGKTTTGLQEESVIGKKFQDIFPSEISSLFEGLLLKTIEKLIPQEEQISYKYQNEQRTMLLNYVPILNKENNELFEVVGFTVDLTEFKKLEEELRKQALMLEQVHDAIFAMDNEYHITYMNKAALQQYEIKNQDKIIGSKLGEYFSFEWPDNKQQKESAKALQRKGVWKGENYYITSTGKKIWADSVISVIKDTNGNTTGMVTAVRDISSRKYMEEQLQKKNNHLTKVNELLEDFVHIAAHDLRGPIASIIVMNEFISLQPTLESKMNLFHELMPLVKKLQRTVDGLLETVNIQKENKITFKNLLFAEIFQIVKDDIISETKMFRGKIKIDFSQAPNIHYVEAHLISMMRNLVSNAIKYSSESKNPQININTKHVNGYILLTVQDNGIGIDLQAAGNNLFKPFKRFTTRAEGTGMGLYIVKNIIEKNGGYITVQSKLNEGTTFNCFLKEYSIDI